MISFSVSESDNFCDNKEKLILSYSVNDENGDSQSWVSEFSTEGIFDTSYIIKETNKFTGEDEEVYLGTPKYKKDGILLENLADVYFNIGKYDTCLMYCDTLSTLARMTW